MEGKGTETNHQPPVDLMQVKQPVRIHKLRADFISRMSSSQGLKIVSIWGAGGIGKTTLAKAVYDSIKADFHCSAFVSVGRQPDSQEKVLRDILMDLGKERYSDLNMNILDKRQLIDELRSFLESRRFLIVIDDIWDMPSWELVKLALVDSACASRIITTSRNLKVAEISGEVFELRPLSFDDSKELFYATLFGRRCTITSDQLDELSTEFILQKCGGVPLAIITIASLLSGKPQEEWREVYNRIGFGDEDNTRNIIKFSYCDLPSHLKTCLLYFSTFPEDHIIEKDKLIWRWVAEGFVPKEQEESSLFKVGERYFYDLINRSMIQPVENEDTNINACCVHDMVLDLIRSIIREGSFVTKLDMCDQSKVRGIAVPIGVLEDHDLPSKMMKEKVMPFNGTGSSYQVLDLSYMEADDPDRLRNLPRWYHKLGRLRYLKLDGLNSRHVRMSIGAIRSLQILDIKDIRALPHSVTQLRQLRCLRCSSPMLELPEGMGNLASLEELRLGTVDKFPNFAEELSKLTELRVLHIHTEDLGDEWREASVESLGKLQKIEELVLISDGQGSGDPCRYVIGPEAFPKLRYMKMNNWLKNQPAAMPCLKSVELGVHVRTFNNANFDFQDFYTLRYLGLLDKAHVAIVCWEAKTEDVQEVEATLRRVVHHHPNRPMLFLNRLGWCADDNKQITDSLQRDVEDRKVIRCLGSTDKFHDSRVPPGVMPLELLKEITKDFSEERLLGTGTFGKVYKGVQNGKVIAVKLLHQTQRPNYEEEFRKEYENLRRLKHPNIIQLLGFSYETKRELVQYEGRHVIADNISTALCFEYMHNGSLQKYLHGESCGLDWRKRYKIIKGTCEGLKYLHEGAESPMYHFDLKPGNILLDENMVPKIADFGLSKLVRDNKTHATSSLLGTIYCPPEYIDQKYVSSKFDVFSLGVVMIEIIAGSEGYCKTFEMPSQEFIDHVQENWRKRLHATSGCTSQLYECHQVKRCIEIALQCVSPDRRQRPSIGDITSWLDEMENIAVKLATAFTSLGISQVGIVEERSCGIHETGVGVREDRRGKQDPSMREEGI